MEVESGYWQGTTRKNPDRRLGVEGSVDIADNTGMVKQEVEKA